MMGCTILCCKHMRGGHGCVDDAASAPQDAVASESAAATSARRLLEDALRKARPRPLIISRLPAASEQTTSYPGCLCGNASLLAGLEAQVRQPAYTAEEAISCHQKCEVSLSLAEGDQNPLAEETCEGAILLSLQLLWRSM